MIPPLLSPSASLPLHRLQQVLCKLQNFPAFPLYKQHLHPLFIPKSSNLLYFSVYTVVHLFAPLCSPHLLSGFHCEHIGARNGICFTCCTWYCVCLCRWAPCDRACQWWILAWRDAQNKTKQNLHELIKAGEKAQFIESVSSHGPTICSTKSHNGRQGHQELSTIDKGTVNNSKIYKPGPKMHKKQVCIYLGAFPPPRPTFLSCVSPILLGSSPRSICQFPLP